MQPSIRLCVAGIALAAICLCGVPAEAARPPATRKHRVIDEHHGRQVVDLYRWLEDADDPEVSAWSDRQNAHARSVLDNLPHVAAIRERVTEIMSAESVSYHDVAYRDGRLFAIKRQPPKQQPFLVVLDGIDQPRSERMVVDPVQLDAEGTTSIDWYVPSHNGRWVAVSLSRFGTESGDVHIYDTANGEEVFESIARVNGGTAGGDLAWLPDDSGFFYTRYPRDGERPPEDLDFFQQLYLHKLGTPVESDRYELGEGLPRIAEIQLDIDPDSGRLLATVQDGDGGEFAHFLRSADGGWRQFSRFGDGLVQANFGPNDQLYLVSRKDAPRGRILRVSTSTLDVDRARTVIGQGQDTIVTDFWGKPTVLATRSRLYVIYQTGGPAEIRVFDHDGKPQPAPEQLPVSSVGELTGLEGDELLFQIESYVEAEAFYHFDPAGGRTRKTALATQPPVDFSDVTVVREFAISKDGTAVPVNILMRRGTRLDGSHPCIATGYGGYGVSLEPRFRATLRVLLDQGIIYAVANLRGGGEYGDTWHRQGNLTNKQNVFDDFAGVLKHLIDRGYTSPARLAIIGGSNGGLLMGATMTQHPGLIKCIVSYVGIYDMLRVELSPNGSFNVPEFGTVENPDHFRALYAYSPYHNVEEGVEYPATLFLTGANDPRVDPMQSRKMTARLQAASASEAPLLLRTSASTGHGGGTALSERIEQTVDVYAFLLSQLGLDFRRGTAAVD